MIQCWIPWKVLNYNILQCYGIFDRWSREMWPIPAIIKHAPALQLDKELTLQTGLLWAFSYLLMDRTPKRGGVTQERTTSGSKPWGARSTYRAQRRPITRSVKRRLLIQGHWWFQAEELVHCLGKAVLGMWVPSMQPIALDTLIYTAIQWNFENPGDWGIYKRIK